MQDRPSKTKGFSTQSELIKKFGASNTKGFCVELANLYAKERIGLNKGDFLRKDEDEILSMVLEEQRNQNELTKKLGGKGALFSAFHDANIDYEPTKVEVVPSKKLLDEVVNYSRHVLISFPTPRSDTPPYSDYHQIFLGRLPGYNRCAYFNSNRPGGEIIGDCSKVTQQVCDDMKTEGAFDGRPTVFGMAKNK